MGVGEKKVSLFSFKLFRFVCGIFFKSPTFMGERASGRVGRPAVLAPARGERVGSARQGNALRLVGLVAPFSFAAKLRKEGRKEGRRGGERGGERGSTNKPAEAETSLWGAGFLSVALLPGQKGTLAWALPPLGARGAAALRPPLVVTPGVLVASAEPGVSPLKRGPGLHPREAKAWTAAGARAAWGSPAAGRCPGGCSLTVTSLHRGGSW